MCDITNSTIIISGCYTCFPALINAWMQYLKLSTKNNTFPYDVFAAYEIFETGCCCGNGVFVDARYGIEEDDGGSVVKQSARFVAIAYKQAQQHHTMKQTNASSNTAT